METPSLETIDAAIAAATRLPWPYCAIATMAAVRATPELLPQVMALASVREFQTKFSQELAHAGLNADLQINSWQSLVSDLS